MPCVGSSLGKMLLLKRPGLCGDTEELGQEAGQQRPSSLDPALGCSSLLLNTLASPLCS